MPEENTTDTPALESPDASNGRPMSSTDRSFSGKVIRNTLYNVVGNMWSMALRFFIAPYTLHHIGNERYGVWAIVGILTGYFGLLDFGLGRSFDKYFAEYYTKRDMEQFNKVFNIGLIFYLLFTVCCILIVSFGYLYFMGLLGLCLDRISPAVYDETVFAIIGSVVVFGWGMATSVFGMILIGLQRMDMLNKINIGVSILSVLGTIIALEEGYGLRGLVLSSGLVAILGSVITVTTAYQLVPGLRLNPRLIEWQTFREMFSFGAKLQVAKLANLVTFQLNSLLISRFFHVSLVTPYSFAAGLIGSVRNVVLMLPSAVIPATAELEARNQKEKALEFYDRGTRYLVLIGTPICTFCIVAAPVLILAWLGKNYELASEAVLLVQLLTLGYYANLSTGVATGVAVGMGKPEYEMKFGVLLAVLSVSLSLLLIQWVGFYGPAIGSTISLSICALYFYRLFHTYLKQPLMPFLRRIYALPVVISLLAGGITYLIQHSLVTLIEPANRPVALTILGVESLVFFGIYIGLIVKTSYLDAYDRSLFRRYMTRMNVRA